MGGSRCLSWGLGITALALFLFSLWILLRPGSDQERPPLSLAATSPVRMPAGGVLEIFGAGFDDHTRVVLYQDIGHRRAIRHSIATGGRLENATVAGDLVFLASNYQGVQVFDFSDPERPRQIGTLETPGKAWKLAVVDKLAYLADREHGFHIIDAADPANLRLLGSLGLGGLALDVALEGDRAYVANSRRGLQVIDVAEPTQPRLLATLALPGHPIAVAVQGKFAYVATANGGGLSIVDIGDPAQPRPTGRLSTPSQLMGLTIDGTLAYLAAGSAGLLIVDIGTPANPRLIAGLKTPGNALKVALAGNRVYLAEAAGGLRVVDIADPSHPQLLGFYGLPGHSRSVNLAQGYAFVATGRHGLQVVDLSHPPDPRPPLFSYSAIIQDLQYAEGQLALAAGNRGVVLVELQPPAARFLSSIGNGGSAFKLAGKGNFLYAINGDPQEDLRAPSKQSLLTIDVRNRQQPAITASLPIAEGLNDLTVDRGYLLAATDQGLVVLSLANPGQPQRVRLFPLPAAAKCLTVLENHALVSDARGRLQVIEVSDPEQPRLIGTATIPWTLQPFALGNQMAASGDLVLVADGRNGLLVFDIADRRRPRLAGVCHLPHGGLAVGVTMADGRAYVTDSRQGVHLIDLTTPDRPQRVATLRTASWAKRIALVEDQILLANGDAGLMSLPRPVEIEQVRIRNASSLTLSLPASLASGTYTVRVFNPWSSAELPGTLRIEN